MLIIFFLIINLTWHKNINLSIMYNFFCLDTNKAAAYNCYRLKEYDITTYYLSEAHGGGIRSKLSLIMNTKYYFITL